MEEIGYISYLWRRVHANLWNVREIFYHYYLREFKIANYSCSIFYSKKAFKKIEIDNAVKLFKFIFQNEHNSTQNPTNTQASCHSFIDGKRFLTVWKTDPFSIHQQMTTHLLSIPLERITFPFVPWLGHHLHQLESISISSARYDDKTITFLVIGNTRPGSFPYGFLRLSSTCCVALVCITLCFQTHALPPSKASHSSRNPGGAGEVLSRYHHHKMRWGFCFTPDSQTFVLKPNPSEGFMKRELSQV